MWKFVRLAVVLLAVATCSCGGGGNSGGSGGSNGGGSVGGGDGGSDTSPAPAIGLPNIVDNYEGSTFIYSDVSLYQGDYEKSTVPQETCSDFFGSTMPEKYTVKIANENYITVDYTFDGVDYEETFVDLDTPSVSDTYSFEVNYTNFYCFAGLFSHNDDVTKDIFSMVCRETVDYIYSCLIHYSRNATNDFTGSTIK